MALNTFSANTPIQSSEINENFSGLADGSEIGAVISNAHLVATAGDLGGVWKAWTITFYATGGTAPTYTTKEGYYTQIGKTVIASFRCQNASGGTPGSGAVLLEMSLPVTASSHAAVVLGFGYSYEASGGTASGAGTVRLSTTTKVFMQRSDTFVNILAQDQSSAERYFNGVLIYEAA